MILFIFPKSFLALASATEACAAFWSSAQEVASSDRVVTVLEATMWFGWIVLLKKCFGLVKVPTNIWICFVFRNPRHSPAKTRNKMVRRAVITCVGIMNVHIMFLITHIFFVSWRSCHQRYRQFTNHPAVLITTAWTALESEEGVFVFVLKYSWVDSVHPTYSQHIVLYMRPLAHRKYKIDIDITNVNTQNIACKPVSHVAPSQGKQDLRRFRLVNARKLF